MTIARAVTPSVQTLIMAGGRGERLYPLTALRPKPAVPFGGVFRIVDFTLSNCLNSGLTDVSLLTQYRHEELQSYIRQSWSGVWSGFTQLPLACVPPRGDRRYRGNADAVFQNLGKAGCGEPETVLILSADQVYQMDYRELLSYHVETNADLTVATVEHPLSAARHLGVVDVDSENRVVGFQEKPSIPRSIPGHPAAARINMGIYVFKKEILRQVLGENCSKGNRFDFGHHIIPSLIGAHIRAYDFRDEAKDVPGYWRDIGSIDNYFETSMDLVHPRKRFDSVATPNWPSYPSSRFRRSSDVVSRLHTKCRVRRSILSPGVHIENGGVVESSILMSRVCIEKGAQIRNSIIEEGVHITAGSRIGYDAEGDRKNHFVTENGVVVVSQSPKNSRSEFVFAARRLESRPRLLFSE